jgi:hypothetical protein
MISAAAAAAAAAVCLFCALFVCSDTFLAVQELAQGTGLVSLLVTAGPFDNQHTVEWPNWQPLHDVDGL